MDKSLSRIEEKIYESSDVLSCMKNLKLDVDSYFSYMLDILKEEIIDYREGYDYTNLKKVANYIKHTYNKLNLTTKGNYRKEIISIIRIYKKMTLVDNFEDAEVFYSVANTLESLFRTFNKEEIDDIPEDAESPYIPLLIDYLFVSLKLEYIDKILKIEPNILNIKIDNKPLFEMVIDYYLKSLLNEDNYQILFYERIINKFLINDNFKLEDSIKDVVIKKIIKFLNTKKLDSLKLNDIKMIIESIRDKKDLFRMFHINLLNVSISAKEQEKLAFDKSLSNRVKLNDYIITIDDDTTTVLDDGISVSFLENGNILFKVHIADPLAILDYNSPLIEDAKLKTTTIYLEDKQLPMIDYSLVSNDLALVEGQDRYAKTFCFECDKSGNILRTYFLNTIVNVSKRESYKSIDALYNKGGNNKKEEEVLLFLETFISRLKHDFKRVERFIEYEASTDILEKKAKIGGFATNLVTYSMLLTGKTVADWFSKNGYPYLYRCHLLDERNRELVEGIINSLTNNICLKDLNNLKGNTPKSFYSRTNMGHFGLGFQAYSHVTSPLRRYSDIINMKSLDMCYFKRSTDNEIERLDKEIDQIFPYLNLERNTVEDYVRNYEQEKVKKLL